MVDARMAVGASASRLKYCRIKDTMEVRRRAAAPDFAKLEQAQMDGKQLSDERVSSLLAPFRPCRSCLDWVPLLLLDPG